MSTMFTTKPPAKEKPATPAEAKHAPVAAVPATTISLRDFFAAAVLQGAIAHHGLFPRDTLGSDCYKMADQMLAAGK